MDMNDKNMAYPGPAFRFTGIAGILFCLALSTAAAGASSEAYLDALRAEAATDAPSRSGAAAAPDEPLTAERSQAEMEAWLRADYMGSYMFYQSMPDVKKRLVYQAYRSGATIAELRQTILDLLKQ